jgi:hypothetical protein
MKLDPEQLAEAIVDTIKDALNGPLVAGRFATLEAEIAALKADHAALDAKALKGGAVWQRGAMYAVNDCVQFDGSIWKCVETHVAAASFSHDCFLLQIKRGRDGKDAR